MKILLTGAAGQLSHALRQQLLLLLLLLLLLILLLLLLRDCASSCRRGWS